MWNRIPSRAACVVLEGLGSRLRMGNASPGLGWLTFAPLCTLFTQ